MNPGTMDDMNSLVQRIKTKQIMINDESASGIVRQLIEYIEQLQKDRTKSESSLHQIEIDYTTLETQYWTLKEELHTLQAENKIIKESHRAKQNVKRSISI